MMRPPRPEDSLARFRAREQRILQKQSATGERAFSDEGQDLTINSLGEYLLPYFLAGAEACWFNVILIGLASARILDADTALLPFWAPPLLLLGSIWLFQRVLQKGSSESGQDSDDEEDSAQNVPQRSALRLMFGLIGLVTIILIWLRVYSASNMLFDPGWLLAFANDLLALDAHFYQVLFIIGIAIYLCWRSLRLAQLTVDPGHVYMQIRIGLPVFLLVMLIRANHFGTGTNADDVALFLLFPIFLYLVLSAHALARASWIRRDHVTGLQGSVVAQERSMLSVITGVGAALLVVTLIGGIVFSPAFFEAANPVFRVVSAAYNAAISVLGNILLFIFTPIVGLLSMLIGKLGYNPPPINNRIGVCRPRTPVPGSTPPPHVPPPPAACNQHPLAGQGAGYTEFVTIFTRILLPALILLALILLVRWALRKRRKMRLALNRKGGDIHESVWSWSLFWGQLRGILWALFGRFFPRHAREETAQQSEEMATSPQARTMREIYRALLNKAASRGQLRKRDETPHEFQARLDRREPENEPQLGLLTEAYALTRYGGGVPNEHELAIIRQGWNELEQKWEAAPRHGM